MLCEIINIGLYHHQLVFCTTQTKKEKGGDHEQILFRSFKKYLADKYEKALGEVMFPNSERYRKAYNNFSQKLPEVVNNIATLRTVRIKNRSDEWFGLKIEKKIKRGR